jgi:hypothetical protein
MAQQKETMTTQSKELFDIWENSWKDQKPTEFLGRNRAHPSRKEATDQAKAYTSEGDTILEIGPGAGFDYADYFREETQQGKFNYIMYEGTPRLARSLGRRFPEVTVRNKHLQNIKEGEADVIYVRCVFEHQPNLEDSLPIVLAGAKKAVVVTWFLPPAKVERIYYHPDGHWNNIYAKDSITAIANAQGWQCSCEFYTDGEQSGSNRRYFTQVFTRKE